MADFSNSQSSPENQQQNPATPTDQNTSEPSAQDVQNESSGSGQSGDQNNSGGSSGGISPFQTPEEKMRDYRRVLSNARDPQIEPILSVYNHGQEKIAELDEEYQKTNDLFILQKKEKGDQAQASAQVEALMSKADASYMRSLKLGRIGFKDNPGAQVTLMLNGTRKRTEAGWKQQRQTFYRNLLANPEYLSSMSRFGYTKEKLEAEYEMVKNVLDAQDRHSKEIGEGQVATIERDMAFEAFEDKMQDFYGVIKVALADHPQLGEKLGFTE